MQRAGPTQQRGWKKTALWGAALGLLLLWLLSVRSFVHGVADKEADAVAPREGPRAPAPKRTGGRNDMPAKPAAGRPAHSSPRGTPDGNAVECSTTKGPFRVVLTPSLAPNGTKFFIGLVEAGYFDQGIAFFRVNKAITQFGITKRRPRDEDPFVQFRGGAQRDENPFGGVEDDEESVHRRHMHPWRRGTIASIGGFHFVVTIRGDKNIGINRHDAPLGYISEEDMADVFDKLYAYNDIIDHPNGGPGPEQGRLMTEGISYIDAHFPETDRILACRVV